MVTNGENLPHNRAKRGSKLDKSGKIWWKMVKIVKLVKSWKNGKKQAKVKKILENAIKLKKWQTVGEIKVPRSGEKWAKVPTLVKMWGSVPTGEKVVKLGKGWLKARRVCKVVKHYQDCQK